MQNNNRHLSVHKFGGSSLKNAERFAAIHSLLTGRDEIIVVSAIQGTTSTLQLLLDKAKANKDFSAQLSLLQNLHNDIMQSLLPAQKADELKLALQKDFADIETILNAIQLAGMVATEIADFILGYGEIWAAKILTVYLSSNQQVLYLDASEVLFVYERHGMLTIDWQKSAIALNDFLQNKSFDQLVITGFIAARLDGRRTTLGRNGSDFSAGIFAKLFKASCLTIWTDVDGIFTADPNRVRSAFVIESLSYKEALELAYFGAKVLHPQTIAPLQELNIPIVIKNSYRPSAKGTYISAQTVKSKALIKGLSSIASIALVSIEGAGMMGVSGIAARIFDILQQMKISVILISQASSEHSICFAIAINSCDQATKALKEQLNAELAQHLIENIFIDKDCAIVAAVGDAMIGTPGISSKLCRALAKAQINIRAISQGSSERNISVVVKKTDVNRALQALHASFYLSPKTLSIGLIGPGQVGATLLQQIHAASHELKTKHQINLCVRGIMNRQQMLLSHDAIDLTNWQARLNKSGSKTNLSSFTNHILSDDVPHAVIIDCTANQNIAQDYLHFIDKGIHVVTPNKHANAGDISYYQSLKQLAQQKNNHYLYEATVCAGLPIISTLQDIIKTGDKIIKIEGIVSGTLSYIFNELAKDKLFSDIVLAAKAQGYTEPDPREDLSGMDVARKLVCLAREIGHDVSLSDVQVYDLVPADLKSCSVDEFLQKLPAVDQQMKALVRDAQANMKRLCYVGSIDENGLMKVAIDSYPETHPFANLKLTDNMLIFHTTRYAIQPLVIQGPGAGASVTSAGIFADLLRLVAYLS